MKKINWLPIITILIFFGAFYSYRDQIGTGFQNLESRILPCSKPIEYSIDTFDARFGINRTQFLKAINQAAAIWEKPAKRQLFSYSQNGWLKINLIYDHRQESTNRLKNLGLTISDDKATYDSLKERYDSLTQDYINQKAKFDLMVSDYNSQTTNYQSEVNYWNDRGGAPTSDFNRLQSGKNQLNFEAQQINQLQITINGLVDNINALANNLNRLAYELNLSASRYNTIGNQTEGEFQEGIYKNGATAGEIDIYQFNNYQKLVRVLAHEMGHALGLDHSDNPADIMYKLNEGNTDQPSANDINALKTKCGIK